VFSVLTPARRYHSSSLELVRAQGYGTVAIITTSSVLDQTICNHTVSMARFGNLEVVYVSVLNPQPDTIRGDITYALTQAKALEPDALLTCLSYTCDFVQDEMKRLSFNVALHSAFECVNQAVASVKPGTFINANLLYVMSPAQFDCRAPFGDVTDLMFPFDSENADSVQLSSSSQFCRAFEKDVIQYHSDLNTVAFSSLAGAQLASLYAFDDAVSRVNDTEPSTELIKAMASVSLSTFFGLIRFNSHGENYIRAPMLRQMISLDGRTALNLPVVSLPISMPRFDERYFEPIYWSTASERGFTAAAIVSTFIMIALGVMTIIRRDQAAIRVTSPYILICILLGSIFQSWAHLTWSVYDTNLGCGLRISVWALGPLLTLGAILHASVRVWAIACDHEGPIQVSRRPHTKLVQFLSMHTILSLAILWVLIWICADNLERVMIPNKDSVRPSMNVVICNGTYTHVFAPVACAFCFALMLVTLRRAIQLRDIPPIFCPLSGIRHVSLLVVMLLMSTIILIATEYVPESFATLHWKFNIRSLLMLLQAWAVVAFFMADFRRMLVNNDERARTNTLKNSSIAEVCADEKNDGGGLHVASAPDADSPIPRSHTPSSEVTPAGTDCLSTSRRKLVIQTLQLHQTPSVNFENPQPLRFLAIP